MAKKTTNPTIENLSEELIRLNKVIEKKENEIEKLNKEFRMRIQNQEEELIEQEKLIIKQELELTKLRKDTEIYDTTKALIKELEDRLKSRKEYISKLDVSYKQVKQRQDEFRHSIVYPLYRFTHNFGKTSVGQTIQRIIK